MNIVGERVRAAREHYNLTQAEFADILSVTQAYLSYIEQGKRPPSRNILGKIQRIYNVNTEWIVHGKGKMIDGEPADIKSLPTNKGLSDFDVLKTIIATIEECSKVFNRQLDPSTKATMIINFYQYYFLDATGEIDQKWLINRIEQSFEVVASITRRR